MKSLHEPADFSSSENVIIEIKDTSFSWDNERKGSNLTHINVTLPKGKLVAVVGKSAVINLT